MNFFEALLTSSVLQIALLAILGASVASGIVGTYVVIKRITSLAGSIAHSVLGGVGCALWLERSYGITWLSPLYGALFAALLSALLMGYVHLYYKEREDAVIAMIWSLGMAIGVIFVAHLPGYNVELVHFLLGNILWVSPRDLLTLGLLDLLLVGTTALAYNRLLALCFDEKQAKLQGVRVTPLYLLLLVLIALSVVFLMYVVGIILVMSLLVLPPAIASLFTRRLVTMMGVAILLSLILSVGGLALSYRLDWPAGATIALFSSAIYLLSGSLRKA